MNALILVDLQNDFVPGGALAVPEGDAVIPLVNALQAFPQSEPTRNRIRLATRSQGPDTVLIEVEDNGPGMTPEVRQHLFDPFFTTKPAGEGTGLGLAICQSIIQSMGGKIEVESELGRGSVFRLLLPAAQHRESAEASR